MQSTLARRTAINLIAVAIVLCVATAAYACPSCKEALAAGDPGRANLVRGFYWSILFMLCTPFAILTGFGSYAYVLVRREARAKNPAPVHTEVAALAEEPKPVEVG